MTGLTGFRMMCLKAAAGLLVPALFFMCGTQSASAASRDAKITPKKQVTITSDTMEALSDQNIVIFKGNVVAVEDFTICSDELYIHYDENKDISEIEAGGNVRIFQDNKTSTSDRAVYSRTDRKVVLTGKPQVKQCTDTIKGDRITVFLDKDNAMVESDSGGRVRAVIMPEKKCPEGAAQEKPISEEARCKGPR